MGNCFTSVETPESSKESHSMDIIDHIDIDDDNYNHEMINDKPLKLESINLRSKLSNKPNVVIHSDSKNFMNHKSLKVQEQSNKYNQLPTKDQNEEAKKKGLQVKTDKGKKRKTSVLNCFSADLFVKITKGNFSKDYQSGKVLGEGAYGKVCLVTHRKTGINRAMKAIKKSSVKKDKEESMLAEVAMLRSLDHPNIVKLYELYQDEKYYYLVTEYCEGGELFDKIQQIHSFSEKQAADYMGQILSSIVYCHAKGIVHRDLKPENLLFETKKRKAQLKVIDFGVSMKYKKGTKMREKFGTPYYIAPEVLARNYDEKCDIWSCGVILYILLCGYPPFNGSTDADIMNQVRIGKFSFDDPDWDPISREAKAFIKRLLTYKPSKRPSAKEALMDKWMTSNAHTRPLNTKIMQNLTSFTAQNKLKQAMLTFMATQISAEKEKEELLHTFKALDSDGNGVLTREELKAGLSKLGGIINNEDELDLLIKTVDTNNSGNIDFSEFVVAAINQEKLLSKKRIEQAFKMFDDDGNGYIEKEELKALMGGLEMDQDDWLSLIEEYDTDGDGRISFNEFIGLLSKEPA